MAKMATSLLLALAPVALGLEAPGGIGRLPAMGWNSWNAYHCDIDESKFLTAAKAMVSMGFKDLGYEYINIDDCWQIKDHRDNVTGKLIPDTSKFSDGISGLANTIHDMGLKIGIYSSAGTLTCAGYQASIGHEELDAATFAEWGIDFLKGYDYRQSKTFERYKRMSDALVKQNRTILYNLCEWGTADVEAWGADVAQAWRSTGDISPDWSRIIQIINENSFYNNYVDFYAHNDPDMLEVGNGNLTEAESRTHFGIWALSKAPLIMGTDLTQLSQTNIDILQNKHLIEFNQDSVVSSPAQPYKGGVNPLWTFNATNPAEYWSGESSKGTLVAMMNTLDSTRTMRANWAEIPSLKAHGRYRVRDVWMDKDLGCVSGGLSRDVESHDTAILLVTGANNLGTEIDPTPAAVPDNTVPLRGHYVTLEALTSDAEYTSLHRNFRLQEKSHLFDYFPVAANATEEELRQFVQKWRDRDFIVYAIKADPAYVNPPKKGEEVPSSRKHTEVLGVIAYLDVQPNFRALEVGGVIFGPRLQRSAAGTEAHYLMLRNVFEPKSPGLGGNSLPYRRVCWKCNNLNSKSRRAAERLGYVFEGTFRNHMIVKGRSRDSDWLSIVEDEWPVVKKALELWLERSNFDEEGRQVKSLDEIRASLK
ncbi:hypothetical protein PRZ48_002701 [Zasmidium cellare]|uniref:Alpha-galactosidase n=1 Tax=Zasmidium cellare TaxID=395010 RepID=A0ABR0ESY3_ZASCE|nr:hypothetical protein PRZ48_002701 [Zasmidium cellare]